MTFNTWLKESCFRQPTQEAEALARSAWNRAEHNIASKEVEMAVELIRASYQSKRVQLKKQVTHWVGKFMIVKAENNSLRKVLARSLNINKALVKKNNEYMVKHGVGKHIRAIDIKPIREAKNTVYEKEPIKC